ncbi:hypothetical protein D3C87_1563750 [compost metagenome]
MYEERGPGTYPDPKAALACPDVGPHLKIQRTRFFDATAFDRFYRDSTPEEFVQTFRDEVHHGVVDVHEADHAHKFARLNKVMQQAALLQASGMLGRRSSKAPATCLPTRGSCHGIGRQACSQRPPLQQLAGDGHPRAGRAGSLPPAALRLAGDDLARSPGRAHRGFGRPRRPEQPAPRPAQPRGRARGPAAAGREEPSVDAATAPRRRLRD